MIEPKQSNKMNPIVKLRLDSMNVPATTNGRTAVIVRTKYGKRKVVYGIQFWTPAMIEGKTSINGDMTTCEYVEHLHPTA